MRSWLLSITTVVGSTPSPSAGLLDAEALAGVDRGREEAEVGVVAAVGHRQGRGVDRQRRRQGLRGDGDE